MLLRSLLKGGLLLKRSRSVSRCRQGQATAIGAVLFLALAVLMVAFMQETYQLQSNMNQLDVDRFQEKVVITSAYLDATGHLVLNVTNQGSVTTNLVRLWLINQTDNEYNFTTFASNYIEPGAAFSHVTNYTVTSGKSYSIRVVTEHGNIASYNIVPAIQARISIHAPSSNLLGKNTTIILYITNNDTSGNNIYNLEPQLTVTPEPSLELLEGPTPSSINLLPPGSSAFFTYVYRVTGSGLTMELNGSFTNAPQGNWVNTTIYATTIDVDADTTTLPIFNLEAFGSIPALLDSTTKIYTYWVLL